MKVVVEKKDQAVVDRWIFSRLDLRGIQKYLGSRGDRRTNSAKASEETDSLESSLKVTDTQSQFQFFS